MATTKLPEAGLWLKPNAKLTVQQFWLGAGFLAAVFICWWAAFTPEIIPSPLDVAAAFPKLLENNVLGELSTSFFLNLEALVLSTIVSLGLAYASVVGLSKPISLSATKLRFISPIGYSFLLSVLFPSDHGLKLAYMVIGISVFFTAGMLDAIAAIPPHKYDHARTLRKTEWQVVYYVVVRGTLAQAFDCIRGNAAMGWAMLTMVESLVRAEGGIGVMLYDQTHHLYLAESYALVLIVLAVGVLQDYGIVALKRIVAPYDAKL